MLEIFLSKGGIEQSVC